MQTLTLPIDWYRQGTQIVDRCHSLLCGVDQGLVNKHLSVSIVARSLKGLAAILDSVHQSMPPQEIRDLWCLAPNRHGSYDCGSAHMQSLHVAQQTFQWCYFIGADDYEHIFEVDGTPTDYPDSFDQTAFANCRKSLKTTIALEFLPTYLHSPHLRNDLHAEGAYANRTRQPKHDDGPEDPKRLWLSDKVYDLRPIEPQPFELLKLLWPTGQLTVERICRELLHESCKDYSRIRNIVSKLNSALIKKDTNITCEKAENSVILRR